MSYDGAGTFSISTTGRPVQPHTVVSSASQNALEADIAQGLSNAICKDGQTTITANIPFNNKKITGLAAGSARTDAANVGNLQDGTGIYISGVGGTADAITLTPIPPATAYAAGQTFRFVASGANTGAVTVNVSSLGVKAVTKNGTTALVAGDIPSGTMVQITYDGTRFILGTPGLAFLPITGGTITNNLTISNNLTVGTVLSGRAAVPGHLWGFGCSNNGSDAANDLDIAVGSATSDDANPDDRWQFWLNSGLTKRLDANWAAGTNQGMLDTGAVGNNTYHIFAIFNPSSGAVDILASLSATSPTMPAGYTKKRIIWSIIRSGGTILAFTQIGDECALTTSLLDVDTTNPGTSAVLAALSVPSGVNVTARVNVWYQNATDSTWDHLYISDPATADLAPSDTAAPLAQFTANSNVNDAGQLLVRTDTSRRIRYRVNVSDGATKVRIATLGWIHPRGKT
jgi:hypothetical protein